MDITVESRALHDALKVIGTTLVNVRQSEDGVIFWGHQQAHSEWLALAAQVTPMSVAQGGEGRFEPAGLHQLLTKKGQSIRLSVVEGQLVAACEDQPIHTMSWLEGVAELVLPAVRRTMVTTVTHLQPALKAAESAAAQKDEDRVASRLRLDWSATTGLVVGGDGHRACEARFDHGGAYLPASHGSNITMANELAKAILRIPTSQERLCFMDNDEGDLVVRSKPFFFTGRWLPGSDYPTHIDAVATSHVWMVTLDAHQLKTALRSYIKEHGAQSVELCPHTGFFTLAEVQATGVDVTLGEPCRIDGETKGVPPEPSMVSLELLKELIEPFVKGTPLRLILGNPEEPVLVASPWSTAGLVPLVYDTSY